MAYSELVKSLDRIRTYMREFYVYGFKRRDEYSEKSARSYDNERRRIESWMGDYMSFRQDASGKSVFLSVDSRRIPSNPLYRAFKAKSFTAKDVTLHFYILDILSDGRPRTAGAIMEQITDYLSHFSGSFSLDESTLRKKLKEYVALGLLTSEKQGRAVSYRRTDSPCPDPERWREAIAFYSEADPMGVIGSFLTDKLEEPADFFRFKHHYILHAPDSEVLYELLQAIGQRRLVRLSLRSLRSGADYERTLCPLKIYVSTQTGRQYLAGYYMGEKRLLFTRLDTVRKVESGDEEPRYEEYAAVLTRHAPHLWGVSGSTRRAPAHIEMTVRFGPGEEFIPKRMEREKRCGTVELLDDRTCRFSADVYDPTEMLPWLRTFIGRIQHLECSDPAVTRRFFGDLGRMSALYGGDDDAVQ